MSEQQQKVIYDPLTELMAYYADKKGEAKVEKKKFSSIEETLKNRIIDGEKIGLENDLNEALKKYSALEIINTILLDGMKVVGELFGSGQMQLPFVLQSAEVMKAAVKHLEQFMEKSDSTTKGIMVIATVKGDVHDIGKNLVNIMLEGAGFQVIDLGVQVPPEKFVAAVKEHKPDIVGMSAFLTTTMPMFKVNIHELSKAGLREQVIVMVGGAPVTQEYADAVGADGYAADASTAVRKAKELINAKRELAKA